MSILGEGGDLIRAMTQGNKRPVPLFHDARSLVSRFQRGRKQGAHDAKLAM